MTPLTPEQVARLIPYRITLVEGKDSAMVAPVAYLDPPPILWPGDVFYLLKREDR